MVIVSVCEYPVDSSSYRAEPLNGVLLDGDTARKVFVAVQKRSSTVKCVECVVQSRAFLGIAMNSTEEYPLLSGRHLFADLKKNNKLSSVFIMFLLAIFIYLPVEGISMCVFAFTFGSKIKA